MKRVSWSAESPLTWSHPHLSPSKDCLTTWISLLPDSQENWCLSLRWKRSLSNACPATISVYSSPPILIHIFFECLLDAGHYARYWGTRVNKTQTLPCPDRLFSRDTTSKTTVALSKVVWAHSPPPLGDGVEQEQRRHGQPALAFGHDRPWKELQQRSKAGLILFSPATLCPYLHRKPSLRHQVGRRGNAPKFHKVASAKTNLHSEQNKAIGCLDGWVSLPRQWCVYV